MKNVLGEKWIVLLGCVLAFLAAVAWASETDLERRIDTSQIVFHSGFDAADLEARIAAALSGFSATELSDGRTLSELLISIGHDTTINPLVLTAALEARNGDLSRLSTLDGLDLGAGGNGLAQRLEHFGGQAAAVYYQSRDQDLEMAGTRALLTLLDDGTGRRDLDIRLERFADAYTRLWDDPLTRDESFYRHEQTRLAFEGKIPGAKANPTWFLLPWTTGETWSFNSGPHNFSSTGSSRPWSALDFGPPNAPECVDGTEVSEEVVRPVASGKIKAKGTWWITIRHWNDPYVDPLWETRYYHLWDVTTLPVNYSVTSSTMLGKVSCAGLIINPDNTPTAHLHIGLLNNGSYVDIKGTKLSGWKVNEEPTVFNGSLTKGSSTVDTGDTITK